MWKRLGAIVVEEEGFTNSLMYDSNQFGFCICIYLNCFTNILNIVPTKLQNLQITN
jgi:hypothetical protein